MGLATACGEGGDASLAGATGDAAMGRIAVSLQAEPGLATGFTAWLRVTAPGAPFATVERESAIDPRGRLSEVVYVPQGDWDVLLDVLTPDGVAVWSGASYGVAVRPGRLTSLEMALDPAGGLVVVAELSDGGDWFEIAGPQTVTAATSGAPSGVWNVGGFAWQAPGTAAPRYYFARLDKTTPSALRIFSAAVPANYTVTWSSDVTLAGTAPADLVPGGFVNATYTFGVAGDHVYLAHIGAQSGGTSQIRLFESGADLNTWRLMSVIPVVHRKDNPSAVYDTLQACSLLITDQFHLFCLAREWGDATGSFEQRLVHVASPDGTVWPSVLPYAEVDGAFRLDALATVRRLPATRTVKRLQVELVGGVYHLWLHTDGYLFGMTGAQAKSLMHAVSGNGRDWSALDEEVGLGPAAALRRDGPADPRAFHEFVTYRTDAGWEMVYRSNTSYLSRAVAIP